MANDKVMIDAHGNEIPIKHVSNEDKKRDKLVNKVIKRVLKLQEKTITDKDKILEEVNVYLDNKAISKGLAKWKGSTELVSFDGKYKIKTSKNKIIGFNENLQLAKQKIDECIKKWSDKSDQKIKILIDKAFEIDKKGDVNKTSILRLRHLEIKDKEWCEAMKLIDESIIVEDTKKYINFYQKNESEKWEIINFNFSSL